MYKVMLVDDEELSLDELGFIMEEYDDIKVVGTFTDPLTALDRIKKEMPDIVFLDVSMPCMSGLELAAKVLKSGVEPSFVFVTAHDKYALKAFDVEAVDYIIKPFSRKRIDNTISRIRKRFQERDKSVEKSRLTGILKNHPAIGDFNWFPVEDRGSIILLSINEIYYCSTEDKKTYVHTIDKRFPTELTLTNIEEKFRDKHLFRCHKSYVVNLNCVQKIVPMFNQNFIIKLKEKNEEIPVSRHYAKSLKTLLGR